MAGLDKHGVPIDVNKFMLPPQARGTVRSAGMTRFFWPNDLPFRTPFTAQPFVDWLTQFPNLEAVSAYPGSQCISGDVILSLMEHNKGVKTIYHRECIVGTNGDAAVERAREAGVNFVLTPERCRPHPFPRPFPQEAAC